MFSPLAAVAMTPETPFLQIQQIQTGRKQTYPNLKEELYISASKLNQDGGGEKSIEISHQPRLPTLPHREG